MVTDQQVALLRQRQMEERNNRRPAMAGMSEPAKQVAVWPVALGDQAGAPVAHPDPFDGVWEEEILPLLRGEAAAGSGQRQLSSGWRRNSPAGSAPPSPHPATPITGLAGTLRTRRSFPQASAGRRSSTSPTATPWE